MNCEISEKTLFMNNTTINAVVLKIAGSGDAGNSSYEQLLTIRHMIKPELYNIILKFQLARAKKYNSDFIEREYKHLSNKAKEIMHLLGLWSKERLNIDFTYIPIYLRSLEKSGSISMAEKESLNQEFTPILTALQSKKWEEEREGTETYSPKLTALQEEINFLKDQLKGFMKAKG